MMQILSIVIVYGIMFAVPATMIAGMIYIAKTWTSFPTKEEFEAFKALRAEGSL